MSEQAVAIGSLFGILHAGTTEKPAVILTSAGTVHRVGPHRFYVSLARRLASLGFPVLRLDLSGIGDSPAGEGVENVTYPHFGYSDLDRAAAFMSEHTKSGLIIAGLCSGGDYAFQMGLRDSRVIGAVILNPRTFGVLELAAVETGNFESVVSAAGKSAAKQAPVPGSLRKMAERGVNTLLVVSTNDPGISYVDKECGADMQALTGITNYVRHDIAGTDHNFTSIWSQETVLDIVVKHLERYQ